MFVSIAIEAASSLCQLPSRAARHRPARTYIYRHWPTFTLSRMAKVFTISSCRVIPCPSRPSRGRVDTSALPIPWIGGRRASCTHVHPLFSAAVLTLAKYQLYIVSCMSLLHSLAAVGEYSHATSLPTRRTPQAKRLISGAQSSSSF